MKTLYCIIASLILSVALFGQAPPVLRQSLTTNTANRPTLVGHVPVWNGTSWIPGFPSTASATNITLPVILLPGSATNDAPNGKVAVAGGGITFTTNNVTNFVISASAGLTNFITNAIAVAGNDFLWTNANIAGTQVLIPTRTFTNEQVGVSNLMILVNSLQYPGLFASRNAEHALSLNATDFGWDRNFTATFLGDGQRGSLVLTNLSANLSTMYPGNDTGAKDDADWNLGFEDARFLTIHTFEINSGNSSTDFWSGSPAASHGRWNFIDNFSPLDFLLMNSEDGFIAPGGSIAVDLGRQNIPWQQIYTSNLTASVGITNNGTYQHSVGAFTGALFVSSNANGVAYWSTNVNNIGVTNLSVYNNVIFNGSIVSNFNRDINWTNTGVVLRNVPTNQNLGLRYGVAQGAAAVGANATFGGIPSSYWNDTNVGAHSVAFGSNNLVIGFRSSILGGTANLIGTNSHHNSIGGGSNIVIYSNCFNNFIGGGRIQLINPGVVDCVIGGGNSHQIGANAVQSIIAGGQQNTISGGVQMTTISGGQGNRTDNSFTTIGGGLNISIFGNATFPPEYGVVGGGEGMTISSGDHNFIGGGKGNAIGTSTGSTPTHFNVIGGGVSNRISIGTPGGTTSNSFIGGGWFNNIGGDNSHFNVIGGGRGNGTDSSPNAFIGGGSNNTVGVSANAGAIAGGTFNQMSTGTNGFIGGGFTNFITGADMAIIPGGKYNIISSSGDFGISLGHSNNINAFAAQVIGTRGTNALAYAIDIAPNGDPTKATFTTSNFTVRTSFATAPDTVVTLAADNQVVDATLRTHIRLASDSAVAGDRTFLLTGTNVVSGAHAILEWTGTNAGELVDDSANSGAGNIRLSATWTPTQYDTLSLIFNGTDWIETARATN